MKNIFSFFIFLIIIQYSFSQNIQVPVTEYQYMDRNEIMNDNGEITISYDIKTDVPDGFYEIFYDSKKERPYMKGNVTNGSKEGKWEFYNEFSLIVRETVYNNGIKNGIEKVYDLDGNVIDEIPYIDGNVEGSRKQYYSNGSVKSEMEISDGIVISMKTFDLSGNLIEKK